MLSRVILISMYVNLDEFWRVEEGMVMCKKEKEFEGKKKGRKFSCRKIYIELDTLTICLLKLLHLELDV